jgi:hypothetical protein
MIKYCFILNEKTGLVQLGAGCSDEYYEEIGMTKRDVMQSDVDQLWYLSEKCPQKSAEEKEQEEKEKQIAFLKGQLNEIDNKKIRPTSAIALNIAVEFDYTKLRELENQAQNIREQLQRLGG